MLVDDASDDGTGKAVQSRFPQVKVLLGDGNLYWAGGMRRVFGEALKLDYDFYLFLNDDTILDSYAVDTLVRTYDELQVVWPKVGMVVGTTYDPETRKATYGGLRRASWWRPLRLDLVVPGPLPIPCDSMNTNCVLVSRAAAQEIGNFDDAFTHRIADIDYGLRARRAGYCNWVVPGFVGACRNDHNFEGAWVNPATPVRERFRQVLQVKGLPIWEWMIFTRRHGGPFWPAHWLWPYCKIIFTSAFRRG
jgi:GT2 family glycosyltransferase